MHGPDALNLLATKLHIPHLRPDAVARPRLLEQLDAGLRQGHRLTLVSAPAGFGKSTLLAAWLTRHRQSAAAPLGAWLALDGDDGDPIRFQTYLVAALQQAAPEIGRTLLARLQGPATGSEAPETWPGAILAALLEDLAMLERPAGAPLILVLDDYHEAASPAIDRLVAVLLERAPASLHLAIATRTEPTLPIARLRARSQVTEVGIAALRFTDDEAAKFLSKTMELQLPGDATAALLTRTEGWAAGLQLAALSLRPLEASQAASFVAGFDGSNRHVADYLLEEVIQGQPAERRDFLLRTSILRRMCAPLCDAVVGGAISVASSGSPANAQEGFDVASRPSPLAPPTSQRLLEECERQNLFLIPLDHQRVWYRYHHLFAGLLQARLQREAPAMVDALHRRAGAWYADAGDPEEAMHHLLAIPDREAAADLAQQYGVQMVGGSRLLTFLRWGEQLGDDTIRRRPFLSAGFGWAHVLTGQVDRALSYVAAGEAALDAFAGVLSLPDRRQIAAAEVRGHLYAVRAYAARLTDDAEAVAHYSRCALAELPVDADTVRCTLALNLGLLEMARGNDDAAIAAFVEAHTSGSRNAANLFVAISALALQGDIHLHRGRLDVAEECHMRAIAQGERFGAQTPPAVGMGYLGLAAMHLLRGAFDAAGRRLDEGMRQAEQVAFSETMEELLLLRTRIALGAGRYGDAAAMLASAARRVPAIDISTPLRRRWALLHIDHALHVGDVQRAEAQAAALVASPIAGDGPMVGYHSTAHQERLMYARVALARGDARKAIALVEPLLAEGTWLTRCEALTLLAQGYLQHGDEPRALATLAQAVELAAPQDVRLPFLAAGTALAGLLRKLAARAPHAAFVAALVETTGAPPGVPSALVEPLSGREAEVLRLMAAGLTNAQIADTLVVAPSTVKTHTNHILAKLQAQNRTEAVARARELGLLTG